MSVYVIIAKIIDMQIKNIKLTRWSRNYLGNEHPFRKVNKKYKIASYAQFIFWNFRRGISSFDFLEGSAGI